MSTSKAPDHLVLRTLPARTLTLTEALNREGVQAWTPSAWIKKRRPRRPGKDLTKIALLPSFLFVPETFLDFLIQNKDKKFFRTPFQVQKYQGTYMTVKDQDLESLRAIDTGALNREEVSESLESFSVGDQVIIDHPVFQRLEAVVQARVDSLRYKVLPVEKFPGTFVVSGSLLHKKPV